MHAPVSNSEDDDCITIRIDKFKTLYQSHTVTWCPNDGRCRFTNIPVNKRRGASGLPLHVINVLVFKCSNRNFFEIEHTYNKTANDTECYDVDFETNKPSYLTKWYQWFPFQFRRKIYAISTPHLRHIIINTHNYVSFNQHLRYTHIFSLVYEIVSTCNWTISAFEIKLVLNNSIRATQRNVMYVLVSSSSAGRGYKTRPI